jgi:hypothetical protein
MEHAGLVRHKKQGREMVWQLERRGLLDARHYFDDAIAQQFRPSARSRATLGGQDIATSSRIEGLQTL